MSISQENSPIQFHYFTENIDILDVVFFVVILEAAVESGQLGCKYFGILSGCSPRVILCETFLHCAFSNVSAVCFLVFLVAGAPCNPLGCSVSPGRGV